MPLYRVMFLVMLLLLLQGCGQDPATVTDEKGRTVLVETASLSPRDQETAYHSLLQPGEELELDFEIAGTIAEITIEQGDAVAPGQLLARLDTSQAVINQARAQRQLAIAEANYQRLQLRQDELLQDLQRKQALLDAGALSQVEWDLAGRQLESLELDLSQAQSQLQLARLGWEETGLLLNKSGLTAPADLYVLDIFFQEGQMVPAGRSIVKLGRLDRLKAVIEIPLEEKPGWGPGQPARVVCRGQSREARVEKISPTASPALGKLEVELIISNPARDWLAGEMATIYQQRDQGEGIFLPLEAVLYQEAPYVYVVDEGTARIRAVEVGLPRGARIEVTGVDPGEIVVTGGMENIRDGDRVLTKTR